MDSRHDAASASRRILDNLPPPLEARDLRSRYGAAMEQVRAGLHQAFTRPAPVDVAIAVVRRAGSTVLSLIDHAADVVAESLQPALQPAFATRALSGAPAAGGGGESCVRTTKNGEGCRLDVSIETEKPRQNCRIRLEGPDGRRLAPMELSVVDLETGKTLVSAVPFASGEAVLRGIEPGLYQIVAESGSAAADICLRLAGDNSPRGE